MLTLQSTVLLLEHDPSILFLMTLVLEHEGYFVRPCHEDAEAIQFLQSETPELVLLDVGPKGMLGHEVVNLLQDDPRLQTLPVLLCTTISGALGDIHVAPSSRPQGMLEKPFDVDDLLAVVGVLVN